MISQLRFVEESFRTVLTFVSLDFLVHNLHVCVVGAVLGEDLAAVAVPGSLHSRMFRSLVGPHGCLRNGLELAEIAIKPVSFRDVQVLLHVLDDVELEESPVVADVASKVPLLQMHPFDVLLQVVLADNLNSALGTNLFCVCVVGFDVAPALLFGEKFF